MAGPSRFHLFVVSALFALQPSRPQTPECANNTINNFWHESVENCQIFNVKNGLAIFDKISDETNVNANDDFLALLKYRIENTLKDFMVKEIIKKISAEALEDNGIPLTMYDEDVTEKHKTLSRLWWSTALDELVQTMDMHKLMQQIVYIPNARLKCDILLYAWQKFGAEHKNDTKFINILAFALTQLLRNSERLTTTQVIQADAVLGQLPKTLRTIYQAWHYNVSFVNHHYNEYIFPDSDKGPSPQQRFLFTYIPPKNSRKVQGKFKLHFNQQGQLAIAAIFNGSPRFLRRENDRVYFCLDCVDSDDQQWWNIVLSGENWQDTEEQYVYLQSPENENLLCATTEFDQYRRWVENVSVKDHRMVKTCQWGVVKRNR